MKLKNIKVYSDKTIASISIGWLNTKSIEIPTRKLLYVFSDPSTWDEVAQIELKGDTYKELAEMIFGMAERDPNTLSEVLLKIAGQHHNPYENEMFKQMLSGRN